MLSEEQLKVLHLASKRDLKTVGELHWQSETRRTPKPKKRWMPGWQTLWRGMKRLSDLFEGLSPRP